MIRPHQRIGVYLGRVVMILALIGAMWMAGCASPEHTARPPESAASPGARQEALPTLTPVTLAEGQRLRVVASTSIIGDVVAHVGDGLVELTVLMGPGQDPHGYEPTAKDIAAISEAHVIFINGLGLEEGLERTIKAAADRGQPVIAVSTGVPAREMHLSGQEGTGRPDPHTWFDPNNVILWVNNIEGALSALDPVHASEYAANAEVYRQQLRELDAYIREQVARIPPERRKLVADHLVLGYFAARYGFEVIGAVIPGFSTVAEPSASDLARLTALVHEAGVPTIFVGRTMNPRMTQVLAEEVGARVLPLYTGALGEPGSGAEDYISMMRTNVDTIVEGLSHP